MKSKPGFQRVAGGLTLVLVLALTAWLSTRSRDSAEKDSNAEQKALSGPSLQKGLEEGEQGAPGSSATAGADFADAPNTVPSAMKPSAQDVANLQRMVLLFKDYARPGTSVQKLIEALKSEKQEPFLVKDANPYTGEIQVVRTKSPFPGTRYFHAQFLTTNEGVQFVQHMSFEFRPGQGAFEQAVSAVQSAFEVNQPDQVYPDFQAWNVGQSGYVVWCKKMGVKDLGPDPFNAYTAADKGTIRCALEIRQGEEEL